MHYIDGYVIPVRTAERDAYVAMAQKYGKIFVEECGALSVTESWGDDVPPGQLTSFPLAVQLKEDETVVFSWVVWASKEARDEGMKKFTAHPEMQTPPTNLPFDGKRMILGGFQVIVEI